jgi:hypothetical protein
MTFSFCWSTRTQQRRNNEGNERGAHGVAVRGEALAAELRPKAATVRSRGYARRDNNAAFTSASPTICPFDA